MLKIPRLQPSYTIFKPPFIRKCEILSRKATGSVFFGIDVPPTPFFSYYDEDDSKLYIGLTELPFTSRYYVHQQSFRDAKHKYSTELSRHVWELKQKKKEPITTWSIAERHAHATMEPNIAALCLTEKLFIINSDKGRLLNRRSELISKCRHQNKFNLADFTKDIIK